MSDNSSTNFYPQITTPYSSRNGRRSIIKCVIEPKRCVFCDDFIDNDQYEEHIETCTGPENTQDDTGLTPIHESTVSQTSSIVHSHQTIPELVSTNDLVLSSSPFTLHDQVENDLPKHLNNNENHDDDIKHPDDDTVHVISQDELKKDRIEQFDDGQPEETNDDDDRTEAQPIDNEEPDEQREHESTNDNTQQIDVDQTEIEHREQSIDSDDDTRDDRIEHQQTNEERPVDDHTQDVSNDVDLVNNFLPERWTSVIDHIKHDDTCVVSSDIPSESIVSLTRTSNEADVVDNSSASFRPIQIDDDDEDDGSNGDYQTPRSLSPMTNDEQLKKVCPFCQCTINMTEFVYHMTNCTDISPINKSRSTNIKENRTTPVDHSTIVEEKPMKKCPMCDTGIRSSEFEEHLLNCHGEPTTTTCFSCRQHLDLENNSGREISCQSRHVYCLTCIQNFMEEYFRRRSSPRCHPTLCDYQLSSHEIAFLPLTRRVSDRLITLARGQQRPQCPQCHFYIDVNETEQFYNHIDVCDGDQITCQYCFYPYTIDQLDTHVKRCEKDKSSSIDKLINFITKRTKYPFTKEQISLFVRQKQISTFGKIDPLKIINALTEYGPIFPYDTPTKQCDVCLEEHPYDDIYVFDCTDNHKLCYQCFHQSCETKMNNGEILTCGMCNNPLGEGELNQLRISREQIQQFQDYQLKKTFDKYSNQTRGVIKCPNQKCTWIAEANDPTERFLVQCPVCKKEFCSICNQQYHYRTTCQQLPQITQQWFMWCEQDRERYWRMRGEVEAVYAAKIQENSSRNAELRRRYEELIRDEQYKAQHCRLCPSCNRVVQRLEGCDKMICGQDAHGGNIQSGCGMKFNWQQAQPYQPSTGLQPEQTSMELPKPEHLIEHTGIQCDRCKNDVVGIRFDCVHCPTLTFCEKCEQQSTFEHSQKNRQSHVFRLIIKPEEIV